jgi:hypothetical protein
MGPAARATRRSQLICEEAMQHLGKAGGAAGDAIGQAACAYAVLAGAIPPPPRARRALRQAGVTLGAAPAAASGDRARPQQTLAATAR